MGRVIREVILMTDRQKVKCTMDSALDDSRCAWCCIYCNKQNCEYRCEASEGKSEENILNQDCAREGNDYIW